MTKDVPSKADTLVSFIPNQTFTGYPDGKTKVEFVLGKASPPVTEAYARLMVQKALTDGFVEVGIVDALRAAKTAPEKKDSTK